MSIVPIYNITLNQGSDFDQTFTWKDSAGDPIDLTGYTARMSIKENYNSSSSLLSLTTANSRITLGGALGTIALHIDGSDISDITPNAQLNKIIPGKNKYVYDLEMVSGSSAPKRILHGEVVVTQEVTT